MSKKENLDLENYLKKLIEVRDNLEVEIKLVDKSKITVNMFYSKRPGPSFDSQSESQVIIGNIIRKYNHKKNYDYPTTNEEFFDADIEMQDGFIVIEEYDGDDFQGEWTENTAVTIYTNNKEKYNKTRKLIERLRRSISFKEIESEHYEF